MESKNLSKLESSNLFLKIVCNCAYDSTQKLIDKIRFEELLIVEVEDGVESGKKRVVYLSAGGSLGHRTIYNDIKFKVE